MQDETVEKMVKCIFRHKNKIDSDYAYICFLLHKGCGDERILFMKQNLEHLQNFIQLLLRALSEDERYVITRHLVDGLDWPRIASEYNRKWGMEHSKTGRAFMNVQQRALGRLSRFYGGAVVEFADYIDMLMKGGGINEMLENETICPSLDAADDRAGLLCADAKPM